MSFLVWPPEINSVLLLDGPGSGPMLEAAAAWDGIVSELGSTANTFNSVTSDLAGQSWRGPASAAMTNAAARYTDWLAGAAAQAQLSAAQARAAATAFERALETIVDPGLIAANRGQLVSLVLSNLFGQTPRRSRGRGGIRADVGSQRRGDERLSRQRVGNGHGVGQWEQALENLPAHAVTKGFTGALTLALRRFFGWPAQASFSATQGGGFSGTPSLATRLKEGALLPVKPFLDVFPQLGAQLSVPNSPFLSLFTGNNPLFSLFLSNSPPQLLTLLLGETVQYGTYNGMSVVQITPAHPSGNYVVAIHGGAFIFSPSIFHWLDYTVMANQTGATIEVPIYPLLQQGGPPARWCPTWRASSRPRSARTAPRT